MNYQLFFAAAVLLLTSPAVAQEGERTRSVTHATLFGIGGVNQLDSYLSPQNYTGPQFQFMHETLRATHLADSAVSFQTLWHGNLAYTKNPTAKAKQVGGDLSYEMTWHYNIPVAQNLRILVGPQAGASLGFLYNMRNGNNPAQLLASMQLSASAAAIYKFHIKRQPLTARYQLDVPLLGLMFSPEYGQSYYEIFSLGNGGHNICATHPFNAFSSRHFLSIDIPLRNITLRAGYLCDIRQSHVNEIKHHSYTHAFMLGWVRHLRIVRPTRTTPEGFIM